MSTTTPHIHLPHFLHRLLPPRPCRRVLFLLLVWTCFVYFVFRATNTIDDISILVNGRDSFVNNRKIDDVRRDLDVSRILNTRELLQNVQETRAPRATTTTSSPSTINVFEAMLAIDQSPKKDDLELVRDLERQLPNLPLVYLHENKNKNWHYRTNKTCARFPTLYDLHINNVYWQETETSNGTFYLYGAYLDLRRTNRLGPTLRILGMIDRLEPTVRTYCQVWFAGQKEPVIAKVLEYKYIWYSKWGNYKAGIFQPYLLACQLPSTHWKQVPISVSIVEDICDLATNNLRVTYNPPLPGQDKKRRFGVCVKGLDFPSDDISVRLVEWIEMLNILGAEKIFLYNLEVHPNVSKVLDYYVRQGKVDLTPLTLPGYQPNMQLLQHLYLKSKLNHKRQNEVIPYNDCLYRNMYRYEYLALLDIDEVIMPLERTNWADLMDDVVAASLQVLNETRASYNFRNVYFMDEMLEAARPLEGPFKEVPPYLHMMQHVYRSANYTKPGQYVKCFHNPEKALVLHNHFPLACLGGVCTSYPVSTDMAHLQHYRADCVTTLKKSCAEVYKNVSVVDKTIWRYKDEVISRTTEALSRLGFFKGVPATAVNSGSGTAGDYAVVP